MKIFLKLPSGAEFRIEREPMSKEQFGWLCGLAAGLMVLTFFLAMILQ